jgi:autotransporter-associated beta strand protein
LIKQGAGTLILSNAAANTYAGGTTISQGLLQIGRDNLLGTGGTTVPSNKNRTHKK